MSASQSAALTYLHCLAERWERGKVTRGQSHKLPTSLECSPETKNAHIFSQKQNISKRSKFCDTPSSPIHFVFHQYEIPSVIHSALAFLRYVSKNCTQVTQKVRFLLLALKETSCTSHNTEFYLVCRTYTSM